jgi:hypothetical protein
MINDENERVQLRSLSEGELETVAGGAFGVAAYLVSSHMFLRTLSQGLPLPPSPC